MKIEENKIIYMEGKKEVGEIEFKQLDENTIEIYHTYVMPEYQGQQIASKLVEQLFKKLKEDNKKAIISCSYVAHWIKKHPEYENEQLK